MKWRIHILILFALAVVLPACLSGSSSSVQPTSPTSADDDPLLVTSHGLIDEALERGDIDEETALLYRIFADFGDERLPAEFHADDEALLISSRAAMEARHRFEELSPEVQEVIGPFLVPPFYQGSWLDLRTRAAAAGTGVSGLSHLVPPCDPRGQCALWDDELFGWTFVQGELIRVWYNHFIGEEHEASAALAEARRNEAQGILELAEEMWDSFADIGMREPLPDHVDQRTGQPIPNHGGDPRLDIVQVGINDMRRPGMAISYTGRYEETPAYILIRFPIFAPALGFAALAHELMHAFQYAYDLHAAHEDYDWMMEATADWAIDHYWKSKIQVEHDFHKLPHSYLNLTDRSLDDPALGHHTGVYLWFFYLARTFGPELIARIFDQVEHHASLEAIEQALQQYAQEQAAAGGDASDAGGFEDVWPGFALRNLNRNDIPVTRHYRDWDGLTAAVQTEAEDIALGGATDLQGPTLLSGVRYLAADYAHFRFTDPEIRSVAFFNGLPNRLDQPGGLFVTAPLSEEERRGINVQALVRIAGREWELQDWTDDPVVTFCRDSADEEIEEVIIITSNGEHREEGENHPSADWRGVEPPTLHISNMRCERWNGTIEGVWPGGLEERVIMDVSFKALPYPLILEESAHFGYTYILENGTMDWSISGEQESCTVTGNEEGIPLPELNFLFTNNLVPGGSATGQGRMAWFHISWPSAVMGSSTWVCPNGTFVDTQSIAHFWVHLNDLEVSTNGRSIIGSIVDDTHREIAWSWNLTAQ